MEDILSKMTFRTAIPFGYLFGMAFFLFLFIAGLVLMFLAYRMKKTSLALLGVILAILPVGIVSTSFYMESQIELDPKVQPGDLVGYWRAGAAEIEFRANGTFRMNSEWNAEGNWSLDEFNLHMSFTGDSSELWRVIQVRDHFRLLRHFPDDPDMWDGDLEYAHQ